MDLMSITKRGTRSSSSLALLVFVLPMFLSLTLPVHAAADTTLYFNPASAAQTVGDDFSLVATINPGANAVSAVELHVTFDQTKLRLDNITASGTFSLELAAAVINNTDGTASIALAVPLASPSVTTTSAVATFAFHALANGTDSPVAFTTASLASADSESGNAISVRTSASVTITGGSSSSSDDDGDGGGHKKKKKVSPRKITNSVKSVHRGGTLTQRGKKFSKNSLVALYFSKPNGTYYPPMMVKTSGSGAFMIKYRVTKPAGKYSWYVVDTKTGKKSKVMTYTVK
ncbi:MAG: hypothetical protein IPJ68_00880 [Candidatus Moraniibacteriota bacterium]|nr:MAG: hypothetical protein IPJ68_00880 [Candidatus Moranbacteria bacterium]